MRRAACILAISVLGLVWAGDAQARVERKLTYRTSQLWSSAVRFLRVDNRYKIVEKDKQTGYLLFEYKDEGRTHPASLELIPTVIEERKVVRARLRIEGMPTYVESVLMDKFLRKLKREYGDAPPAELAIKPKPASGSDGKASKSAKPSGGSDEEPEDEEDLEVEEEDLEGSTEEEDD
jgi:hypothetical protein